MSGFVESLSPVPTLVERSFLDVDAWSEFVNTTGRQVQIDQLSLGSFHADVWFADFGNLQVGFAKYGCPMFQVGDRRKHFIHFDVLLAVGPGANHVHGTPIDTNHLFSFDPQQGSKLVLSPGTLIGDILVRQDLFTATCDAMCRNDIDHRFLRSDIAYLPTSLTVYQGYLQQLFTLIKERSPLLQSPEYRQMIIGDLLPLLIDTIPRNKRTFVQPPTPSHRAKLISRAREFIQANLHRPLTLKDIYTELGISRRTLYYGFETIFGMTPMEYLKVQRLQGVRRSLKQADSETSTVTTIAHKWGFCNLGQFAKAYQAMFDELPSQSLRNSH